MKAKKPAPNPSPISPKEEAFVEFYLVSWNAADAARRAGYEPDRARFTGRDLLTKRHIKQAIRDRLKEISMTTEEWYARLTDQARASLEPFISPAGEIDLEAARQANKLHQLLEFETEEFFKKDEEGNFQKVVRKKVKLHSVQGAHKLLGQRLGAMQSDASQATEKTNAAIAKHKLTELQKKEALLDLIKRRCPPEVYEAVLAALSAGDEHTSGHAPTSGEGQATD